MPKENLVEDLVPALFVRQLGITDYTKTWREMQLFTGYMRAQMLLCELLGILIVSKFKAPEDLMAKLPRKILDMAPQTIEIQL